MSSEEYSEGESITNEVKSAIKSSDLAVEQLHNAVDEGNIEEVKRLLQQDVGVDSLNKYFQVPALAYAVLNENTEMINFLLDNGADINLHYVNFCIDLHRYDNSLHIAITKENIELIELLIKRGGNVNMEGRDGYPLLYYAILTENMEIMELLINHGANINYIANFNYELSRGEIWFDAAVRTKNSEIVNLLLDHGADINLCVKDVVDPPIFHAVRHADVDIIKILVERGANLDVKNKRYKTVLDEAVSRSDIQILEFLLENDDFNLAQPYVPSTLCYVENIDDLTIVKFLLQRGAHINADYMVTWTLYVAVECGELRQISLVPDFYENKFLNEEILRYDIMHEKYNNNSKFFKYLIDNSVLIENKYGIFTNDLPIRQAMDIIGQNELIDMLLQQIIKLLSLNLYVCHENLYYLYKRLNIELVNFSISCEAEVAKLKITNICSNSSVSLYDILTKSFDKIKLFLQDEERRIKLSSIDFSIEFPIYSGILNYRIKLGIRNAEIYKKGYDIICKIIRNVKTLPDTCIRHIISYFTNADLKFIHPLCNETEDK